MLLSSILVVAHPGRRTEVAACLETLPGAEIYARHEATGRYVVVQEAADPQACEQAFRRIQELPGVVSARLVRVVTDAERVAS